MRSPVSTGFLFSTGVLDYKLFVVNFTTMLRGANVLFKDYLKEEAPVIPIDRRQGRSSKLDEQRNELLIHRYHYHRTKKYDGKTISFESLISTVAAEFFLSEFRLTTILQQNNPALRQINKKWKDEPFEKMCRAFAKDWPHLVWA